MEHLETLFLNLKDARRALLQRQFTKFSEVVNNIDGIDTDILKAELSSKDKAYLDEIFTTLIEFSSPLGLGKAISENDSLIFGLSIMTAKVTDSLVVVKELQERWERSHTYPRELWEVFKGETPDEKKKALREFIEGHKDKKVSDIARGLSRLVCMIPKSKEFRHKLGVYLPQLISGNDTSLNVMWNRNFNTK